MMRTTHTLALMQVFPSTYADIRGRLERAGYEDQILSTNVLDMHGIGIEVMPPRMLTRDDDVYRKMREGHYYAPDAFDREAITITQEHFKRDALRYVGLDEHPRADEIYTFACRLGSAGGPMTIVWILEGISAFMK